MDVMKSPTSLFTAHPASVNESYGEHMLVSWSFAWRMLVGACACFVHGLFPFLCVTRGSATIRTLHERMVTHRVRHDKAAPGASIRAS
jgi:Family of unknown function (DUF6356)